MGAAKDAFLIATPLVLHPATVDFRQRPSSVLVAWHVFVALPTVNFPPCRASCQNSHLNFTQRPLGSYPCLMPAGEGSMKEWAIAQ